MAFKTWAGSSVLFGTCLVFTACGDDSSGGTAPASDDGGAPEASTPAPPAAADDAGPDGGAAGTIKLTPQKLSSNVGLMLGMTADDQIIYLNIAEGGDVSLKAAPLAGGTPATIKTGWDNTTSDVVISGGAVGFWTDELDGLGTFHVWTKATGTKSTLSTTSVPLIFASSPDGTQIAFTTATSTDDVSFLSTELVFAETATVTDTAPTLFSTDRINLAAVATCFPTFDMRPNALVASFCVGEDPSDIDGELFVVPAATKTPIRLDNIGAAGANGPVDTFVFANEDASRIYALNNLASSASRLVLVGTDAASSSAVALEDQSARTVAFDTNGKLVYRTATGLRIANATATPTPTTLVDGAREILDYGKELAHVLVRMGPRAGQQGELSDVAVADTTKMEQTPLALLDSPTAKFAKISGAGTHLVYIDDNDGVRSMPIGGGASKALFDKFAKVSFSPTTNGLVGAFDPVQQEPFNLVSLRYYDGATGESSNVLASGVDLTTGYLLTGKALVFFRLSDDGPGLFKVNLPD